MPIRLRRSWDVMPFGAAYRHTKRRGNYLDPEPETGNYLGREHFESTGTATKKRTSSELYTDSPTCPYPGAIGGADGPRTRAAWDVFCCPSRGCHLQARLREG